MDALFKKLNFKEHRQAIILHAPASFAEALAYLQQQTAVATAAEELEEADFGMAFVMTQTSLDAASEMLASKIKADGVLWICYPKGSSKRYSCEFNRDTGWDKLGSLEFEPVRQVAIDEDWSALRFRRVQYIKNLSRGFAISEAAKQRLGGR